MAGTLNRSGRKPGQVNKVTLTIRERIQSADPLEYLIRTMRNDIPCITCKGKGKTKFQPKGDAAFPGERTCQSCWGSGKERISPSASADAAAKLMNYIAPTLKAIEHSGVDGAPIDHKMQVVFVNAKDGRPAE